MGLVLSYTQTESNTIQWAFSSLTVFLKNKKITPSTILSPSRRTKKKYSTRFSVGLCVIYKKALSIKSTQKPLEKQCPDKCAVVQTWWQAVVEGMCTTWTPLRPWALQRFWVEDFSGLLPPGCRIWMEGTIVPMMRPYGNQDFHPSTQSHQEELRNRIERKRRLKVYHPSKDK